jgi:hypothetical protein
LLLIAVAVALPLSVRAALRAFGQDEAMAVFASMPLLSRPLFLGFFPYVASLPLYFFGVALFVRRATAAAPRWPWSLSSVALALFYVHTSGFVAFVVTVAALEVALAARRAGGRAPPLVGFCLARARALVWLAPALAAAATWFLLGRMTLRGSSLADGGEIGRMGTLRSLYALPLWTFDVFRAHVDEVCGAIWWAALVGMGLSAARRSVALPSPLGAAPVSAPASRGARALALVGRVDLAYVPLFAVLLLYFVTPFRVGAAGMLNVRLAMLVALTATLVVGRSRGLARLALVTLGCLATVGHAANAAREITEIARVMEGFDELLGAMRPATRLVTLAFNPRRERAVIDPYPFAGSYHRARGGVVAGYSFSDLPHWAIQYREASRPPQKAHPLWIYAPCWYRNAVDGAYYDYVLVNGGPGVFDGRPLGPAFRELRRTRGFVLYEKVEGEPAWDGPEALPGCRPPAPAPPRPGPEYQPQL